MDDDEEIIDWKSEALAVVNDIKDHVSGIELSNVLPSDETKIYLNVTTIEGEIFCIRLNSEGFLISGHGKDSRASEALENQQIYETPYSLLSAISKKFTESFGNRLINELSKLENRQ
ncbi:uncharacterized protein LOC134828215 [Culicoides brevitarsis]|uniref:uncharacterized protein LOC134828215 n=1 Tax=Culicoides brevitarsis TaxID=469753 RepID=UPI00307CAE55